LDEIRVLLVDENDDFLDGLSAWLSLTGRFAVAGVAHSGQQAVERAASFDPDVVLMDMRLPDISGLEATRRIKSRPNAPCVVLMAFHVSEAILAEARAAGADRCLSKYGTTRDFPLVAEDLCTSHRRRETGPDGAETSLSACAPGSSPLPEEAHEKEGGRT